MSLTISQYRQTGSDSLLMESRQVSSVLCLAQREREPRLPLIPPSTKVYRSHPQGMSAPIVPASPASLRTEGLW